MSFTAYSRADLKTQMTTGALGTALATFVTNDDVASIKEVLDATTGDFAGTVAASPMPNSDFQALWDGAEVDALPSTAKDTLSLYSQPDQINIGAANVQSMVESVFGPVSNPACATTYARMVAAYTRPASFVEARYGSAFAAGISTDEIQAALELP